MPTIDSSGTPTTAACGAGASHKGGFLGVLHLGHVYGEVLLDVATHVDVVVGDAFAVVEHFDGRLRTHRGERGSEHVEQLVVGGHAFLVEGELSLYVGDVREVLVDRQTVRIDGVAVDVVRKAFGLRAVLGECHGGARGDQSDARRSSQDLLRSGKLHGRPSYFSSSSAVASAVGAGTRLAVSSTVVCSGVGMTSFALIMTVWVS